MDRTKMSRSYIIDILISRYKEIISLLLALKSSDTNEINLDDIPLYIQAELKENLINAGFTIKEKN